MKKVLAILAFMSSACWFAPAATLNPSASKAYVDKKVAEIYSVIEEKSVFTNTLQVVSNIYYNVYTNTYQTNVYNSTYNVTTNTVHNDYQTNFNYNVTYKTNVYDNTYNLYTNIYQTVVSNTYYNVYTNNYSTNIYNNTYNVTTNTYHSDFTTNYYYNVTYRTNVTVNITDTTNITTEVHNTTNINQDVYITNTVNVVTNDIVFTDTVWYSNDVYAVNGYTGVIIRATSYEGETPVAYSTNAVVFSPDGRMEYAYTNQEFCLFLMEYDEGRTVQYALRENDSEQKSAGMLMTGDDTGIDIKYSYEGESLADATKLSLPFLTARSMSMSDLALVLVRAATAGYEKETRHVRYNPTMAAAYSEESLRLSTEDGMKWIDATGIVWEVSGKYVAPGYSACGETLLQVPVPQGEHESEVVRYENSDWRIYFQHDDDRYSDFGGLWTLEQLGGGGATYTQYGEYAPNGIIGFYEDSNLITVAYPCEAVTNGVVRTNAVKKVMFSDDVPSVEGLTKFDGKSVSTNQYGELEILGYRSSQSSDILIRGADSVTWVNMTDFTSRYYDSFARNVAWSYAGGILYNCYVQIGRKVYSAGDSVSASISVSLLPDGAYGVGVSYNELSGTYSITFGLVSAMSSNPNYDSVVFTGTLSHGTDGAQTWRGIASVPLILVFE